MKPAPINLLPICLLSTAACSEDAPAAKQDAAAAQTSDTDTETNAENDAATSTAKGTAPDTGPAFDCAKGCATFAVCDSVLPKKLCEQLCSDPGTAKPAINCLTSVGDCGALMECMVSAAEPPKKPIRVFDNGKTGTGWKKLAGDFTIPTRRGPWTFSEHYGGHDSYIFIFVGTLYGCAKQVDLGTVPNQFGTWHLGRAGWCPGKGTRVQYWDITDRATPGETFTISYKALYNGKDYQSQKGNGGGFGARIDMTSWVMFYQ